MSEAFLVVPISRTILVEGRGRRDEVRGLVLAVGYWQPADDASRRRSGTVPDVPELQYLVSDESKPAPVWVEARHLTSQQWFPLMPAPAGSSPAS